MLRAQPLHELRAGLLRRTAIERWLWVVLERKLQRLGDVLACQFGGQREAEVDAGGHARARDAVAVADDALRHRLGPEPRQVLAPHPVARGLVALQQPGSTEHERTIADRGDVARRF